MNIKSTLLTACMLVVPVSVNAAVVTIDALNQGWYDDTGSHISGNPNYLVGDWAGIEFRNWFVFDLSAIGAVSSATLRAYNIASPPGTEPGFISSDASETWSLFDIVTNINSLMDGTGGLSAFNDLAAGTGYGSQNVSTADNGAYVEVTLNASALAAISSAAGNFGIGGALTTLGGSGDEKLFWYSHEDPRVELVVNTIPVPAAVWLFGSGLLGLVGVARRC